MHIEKRLLLQNPLNQQKFIKPIDNTNNATKTSIKQQ